jgi:hypothetical protein
MHWIDVFGVLIVSHLVGDFLLQTEWQATHKHGGLTDPRARRALAMHVLTYTLAYVPALIWIALNDHVVTAVVICLLVAIPHFIQDDARVVSGYMRIVKHTGPRSDVALYVDQSMHVVVLFGLALLAAAW